MKEHSMSITEIRKGLRKLDFIRKEDADPSSRETHVVVEFEVSTQLAKDQLVLINLGLRDGINRELMGLPKLVNSTRGAPPSYTYRLEGDV
jgi:hypothetical protein